MKYAPPRYPLEHRHGQAHAAALADFSFLGRKHPLNRHFGMLRHRTLQAIGRT